MMEKSSVDELFVQETRWNGGKPGVPWFRQQEKWDINYPEGTVGPEYFGGEKVEQSDEYEAGK